MNKSFIYFFFQFLSLASQGQVVSSSCSASDSIIALYRNDADRMAIRRVNLIHSSYKDSVKIDDKISKRYLDALVAVHNATALAANDTIIRLLNIHTYNPGLNSLVIIADSNLVWMTNLRFNILPTRDYAIDKIIARYSLKKVFYSGLLQPSLVVFKTEANSNLAPLAKEIKSFLGVRKAEPDFLYGDGNDIKDVTNDFFVELIYSYGWMNCPSGCQQRRYWRFRVHNDFRVEYLESYGSQLEPSLIISPQENETLFKDIKIYPNPAKTKIYIECKELPAKNIALTVFNKKNEVVYSIAGLKGSQEVDLILLSNGVYYLKLQDTQGQKTYRIYKQ